MHKNPKKFFIFYFFILFTKKCKRKILTSGGPKMIFMKNAWENIQMERSQINWVIKTQFVNVL